METKGKWRSNSRGLRLGVVVVRLVLLSWDTTSTSFGSIAKTEESRFGLEVVVLLSAVEDEEMDSSVVVIPPVALFSSPLTRGNGAPPLSSLGDIHIDGLINLGTALDLTWKD